MNQLQKQRLDTFIILIITVLVAISCVTLYSLQDTLSLDIAFHLRQAVWYVLGMIAIGFVMLMDFDQYRRFAWAIYILGILSLIGLFFWGVERNDALSWYEIPIIGNTIQPAEFMKIFLIIAIANVIASHNEKWKTKDLKYDFVLLGKIIGLTLPPMLLILVQPDTGTAIVILSIAAFMIVVSGVRWRVLLSLAGIGVLIIGVAATIYLMFPEQIAKALEDTEFSHVVGRIQAWLNPQEFKDSDAAQAIKSTLAIGSGQLFGNGFMDLQVYVYERHTDMIFSAIAEQFGFIGSSIVIVLYFLLIYRIIQIALECRDPFGTYLCIGVVGMLTYQIFQNIGMSIQLLPLTGLPLPFLSYGGTSLLLYMIAIGIVLNVRSRQKSFMFESKDDD